MCGRKDDPSSEQIQKKMPLKYEGKMRPANINVKPTDLVPVVASNATDTLQYFKWWLIPNYAKTDKPDWKYSMFNAKSENLQESKSIWSKLVNKQQHCVFICNAFYEWNWADEKGKVKRPFYIKAASEPFTFMAGLWEEWVNRETGEVVNSCSLITNPANEIMAEIHNTKARMPAFLTNDNYKHWIDSEIPLSDKLELIKPVPSDFLQTVEIKKVGDEEEYKSFAFC
jgi:putative SOS response-associated peptidase YedK